jgi:hypothetical protein
MKYKLKKSPNILYKYNFNLQLDSQRYLNLPQHCGLRIQTTTSTQL